MLPRVKRASYDRLHGRRSRHLAELFTKEQPRSLPLLTQCLPAKRHQTSQRKRCVRFVQLSRSRDYFQLVFVRFRKLPWVAHEKLKGKLFPFHSSSAQKQELQGTEVTSCSTLANTNVSITAALDTC